MIWKRFDPTALGSVRSLSLGLFSLTLAPLLSSLVVSPSSSFRSGFLLLFSILISLDLGESFWCWRSEGRVQSLSEFFYLVRVSVFSLNFGYDLKFFFPFGIGIELLYMIDWLIDWKAYVIDWIYDDFWDVIYCWCSSFWFCFWFYMLLGLNSLYQLYLCCIFPHFK